MIPRVTMKDGTIVDPRLKGRKMIAHQVVRDFWKELEQAGNAEFQFFTKPELCWKDQAIYKIQTKDEFIFDDYFWDIFHEYPFHICHINFGCYGNVYELRFKIVKE